MKTVGLTVKINGSDEDVSGIGFQITLIIIAVVSGIAGCLIWYYTLRFFKIVGTRKKLQNLFLACLGISSLGRVFLFTREVIIRWDNGLHDTSTGEDVSLHWLNAAIFQIAITVNIFNWIYQTLRLEKFRTGIRTNQTGHHILFCAILVMITGIYIGIVVSAGSKYEGLHSFYYTLSLLYGATFCVLAIMFATVGIGLYRKFSQVSCTQAKLQKPRIFITIGVIFFAFMSRGVSLLVVFGLRRFEGVVIDWISDDEILSSIYIFMFIIMTDVFPTLFLGLSIKWLTSDMKKLGMKNFSKIERSITDFTDLDEPSFQEKEGREGLNIQRDEFSSEEASDKIEFYQHYHSD